MAKQRQIQIDLLQEEINNTKQIWETVKSLMDGISGYGSWDDILKGEIKREAYQAIIDQLKKSTDFEDKSAFDQDNQINDYLITILTILPGIVIIFTTSLPSNHFLIMSLFKASFSKSSLEISLNTLTVSLTLPLT